MYTAIILSGGIGTRLYNLVTDVPKPLAPINNRPFLEYLLDYWIERDVTHFILSVGYMHEKIIEHLGNSYRDIEIDFVIEEEPLDTGGGFLLASKKILNDKPFLLINGDTFFAINLEKLLDKYYENNADWVFSLFSSNDLERYMGIKISERGKIINFYSSKKNSLKLVNGGVYLVNPKSLLKCEFSIGSKVSLENEYFPKILDMEQRLYGVVFNNTFIDIGAPDDYKRASKILTD